MNKKTIALMALMFNAVSIVAADTETLITEQAASAGAKSGGAGWLTAVAIVLALAGIAVAVYCYLHLMKIEAQLPQLKKAMDKQSKQFEQSSQDSSYKISKLVTEINRLRSDVAALNRPAAPQPAPTVAQPAQHQANPVPVQRPVAPPEKLYFVVPVNNVFSSPSSKFEAGRTLYCMTVQPGSNRATFEYCDDSASVTIAKRSISRFVESGCTIVDGQDSSFSRIRTIQPGEVVRSGAGWVIERKAQVELI